MAKVQDRRKVQTLYPEPKARAGMAAKKPVQYDIPVIKLFLLLFIPPFAVTVLSSMYLLGTGTDQVAHSLYFVIFVTGLILLVLLCVSLLSRAGTIIARNCSVPHLVEGLYFVLMVLAGWMLTNWLVQWSAGMTIVHVVVAEAVVFFVLVLSIVLFAKQLSR